MKRKKFLYCLGISILFLCILSKNSPFYQMNDWYDVNAFFTVGKSMLVGKIPYLDLFEQKGPLLYLIYAIAALISNHSFFGVFILEVISLTCFFYYIEKIIDLYLEEKFSYLFIPILACLILSSRSFTHGGSCEEFTFPFLIMTVYYFLMYLKTNQISNKQTLLVGVLTGIIFWMKYTLIGFSIGFCLVVLIKERKNQKGKVLLEKIGMFLLGFFIVTIPIILYFFLHHGLSQLIDVYFLFNMKSYAKDSTIIEKITSCIRTIIGVLKKYYQYLLLIIIPMLLSIKTKTFFKEKSNNFYLLLSTLLLLIFIFIGGTNYRYYSLPMQPFMIFGLIWITKFILKIDTKKRIEKGIILLTIIEIPLTLTIAYYHSPNTSYLSKKKEDYAQFSFLKEIEKGKTILNFGCLDSGFYFSTNTIPTVYYFQKNNINYSLYPDNMDEQRRYVKEKVTDYVITSNKISKADRNQLEKNYQLVLTQKQEYEQNMRTYYLYQKK